MKSKISLFNWGVSKNLLRRCWPLWAAYLVVIMLLLPAEVANRIANIDIVTRNGNRYVLNAGIDIAVVAVFVGIIAAMTMFSYLYTAKGSGMMCSLPLRRETVFLTAYFTGIVPLLIIDVLAVVVTWFICLGTETVRNLVFVQTLAVILTANIAFYNFAVLCTVLTGSIIVLPLVYFVLNAAADVAESLIRYTLSAIVYGMANSGNELSFLSPMIYVFNKLGLHSENNYEYTIVGMNYLLIFMAVSFLMIGLAVFILRRRHMECATDVVAVPVLKPIFKYCLSAGCGFVFFCIIYEGFFRYETHGLVGMPLALFVIVLLAVGAFIGYFAAEMLMQKTVRVFENRKKYIGWGICSAVLAVFILCFEFDAFGYERYVPELDEVKAFCVEYDQDKLTEKENIEKAVALHSQIISNKELNENAQQYHNIPIEYVLENGRRIKRMYPIASDWESINDENSDAYKFQKLINVQEAIDYRCEMKIPLTAETVYAFNVVSHTVDEVRGYEDYVVKLTAEQAVDFYNNYLLPDINEGKMGRRWVFNNEEYFDTVSNVEFHINLDNRALLPVNTDSKYVENEYFTFTLNLDAERCVKWVEENTDVEVLKLVQAENHYAEMAEKYGLERAEGAVIEAVTVDVGVSTK